jgi:hypothetical protein
MFSLMNMHGEQITTIKKEMGLTHKDFYAELPNLLNGIAFDLSEDTVKFQVKGKCIEISLGPEGVREIGPSVRLPVTPVTLSFFDFSEEEIDAFVSHFNLKFMKGGG